MNNFLVLIYCTLILILSCGKNDKKQIDKVEIASSDFVKSCNNPANEEEARTFKAILEGVNANNCNDAEKEINEYGSIYLHNKNIKDLNPLKYFPNIIELDISENKISDLGILKNFVKLKYLYLDSNLISDITVLKSLKKLKHLDLSANYITNIEPIIYLEELENLTFKYFPYEIQEELLALQTLRPELKISGIINRYGVAEKPATKFFYICMDSDKRLVHKAIIDRIFELTNSKTCEEAKDKIQELVSLNLSNLNLTSIEPLEGLVNLEVIDISFNELNNIKVLSTLYNLTYLDISDNNIQSIEPVSNLKNLIGIYAVRNIITDLSPLDNLYNLKRLILTGNKIENIEHLSNLTNLNILSLQDNKIKSLKPLQNLINLKKLYIKNNNIENSSELAELKNNGLIIKGLNQ